MTAMTALLGFAAWTLLLMLVYVNWRGVEVLRGVPANSWTRGTDPVRPGWAVRAEHAHLNCLENLPIFAVIVLAAYVLDRVAAVEPFAAWVLYARLGQSLTHLVGISHGLVLLRALFFIAQIVLFFIMLWSLAT